MTDAWEAFKAIAVMPVLGMPLWSLLLFGVVLPLVNEIIMRSGSVKAMSFLQAVVNFVKSTPLYALPIVKQIVDALASKPAPVGESHTVSER